MISNISIDPNAIYTIVVLCIEKQASNFRFSKWKISNFVSSRSFYKLSMSNRIQYDIDKDNNISLILNVYASCKNNLEKSCSKLRKSITESVKMYTNYKVKEINIVIDGIF